MNLIKLHGHYGHTFWVDCAQLANLNRTQLSIYTSRGNRLCDVNERTGKSVGNTTIHRGNLFGSAELAAADIRQFGGAPSHAIQMTQ